jgi:hypothetical protein
VLIEVISVPILAFGAPYDKTPAANVTYRHPSWQAPPPEAIANSSATLRESTLVAGLKMVPGLMADMPSWIVSYARVREVAEATATSISLHY